MDRYCFTCGAELITAMDCSRGKVVNTTTYCPFCTIIKKKPMKTFFIHWKNGLGERLPSTSITNALVIARYDAAAINSVDYYTIDDNPTEMRLLMPELIRKKQERTQVHIIVYTDSMGHKQLIEGFDEKDVAEGEKKTNTQKTIPIPPL